MNRMKKEHNVACLWVDNLEYQSNTVIIAELVLRGRPQPVHKAFQRNAKRFVEKLCVRTPFREVGEVKRSRQSLSQVLILKFHILISPIIDCNDKFLF